MTNKARTFCEAFEWRYANIQIQRYKSHNLSAQPGRLYSFCYFLLIVNLLRDNRSSSLILMHEPFRSAPDYSIDTELYRQLQVKDLSKVPTWWLEWDSNLRPPDRRRRTLPLSHLPPQIYLSAYRHLPEKSDSYVECIKQSEMYD